MSESASKNGMFGPTNQSPLPPKRTTWISLPPYYIASYSEFMNNPNVWDGIEKRALVSHNGDATVKRLITEIPAQINEKCTYLVYHYIEPHGVAVVDLSEEKGYVTVRYLLSDGAEYGIGMTLLEVAANYSQANGCGGKLRLIPDNDDLPDWYKKLGFVVAQQATMISGEIMTLDPRQSDKWHFTKKEWRLKANNPTATWR